MSGIEDTISPPPDDERAQRFVDSPVTRDGKPRQRPSKAQRETWHQRVEMCRAMLRLNFGAGDIKRKFSKDWNLKPRAIEAYIAAARKRNRDVLKVDEDQSLADSLAYWSGKQQDAEMLIQRERQHQARAQAALDACEAEVARIELESTPDSPQLEKLEVLELRKRNALTVISNARKAIYSATMTSTDCQQHIDKLKGNFAPVKFAKTDAKGNDVAPPPVAPITMEDVDAELLDLIGQLRARGIGPSAEPVAALPERRLLAVTEGGVLLTKPDDSSGIDPWLRSAERPGTSNGQGGT